MIFHRIVGFTGGGLLAAGVGMFTVPEGSGIPAISVAVGAGLLGFVLGAIADRCSGA